MREPELLCLLSRAELRDFVKKWRKARSSTDCDQPGNKPVEAIDEAFLAVHRAELLQDGDRWELRYPFGTSQTAHEKSLRVLEMRLSIVGKSRADALMISKIVLRDHKAPARKEEPLEPQEGPIREGHHPYFGRCNGHDRRREIDLEPYQLSEAL